MVLFVEAICKGESCCVCRLGGGDNKENSGGNEGDDLEDGGGGKFADGEGDGNCCCCCCSVEFTFCAKECCIKLLLLFSSKGIIAKDTNPNSINVFFMNYQLSIISDF